MQSCTILYNRYHASVMTQKHENMILWDGLTKEGWTKKEELFQRFQDQELWQDPLQPYNLDFRYSLQPTKLFTIQTQRTTTYTIAKHITALANLVPQNYTPKSLTFNLLLSI